RPEDHTPTCGRFTEVGASIGDFLSQPTADGGRGLGTAGTSAIFLATILAVVIYLARTRKDQIVVPV
ncbi:MAG: hypothetical protein M3Y04_10670, partial [Actinomycetota bacterium]|nr:hypothetical protein [Actinomycetota bacterium]